MNRRFFLTLDLIVLFAMLGSTLSSAGQTQAFLPSPVSEAHSTDIQHGMAAVDANIYTTLEREGTAQVLVILQQQADLSGADWLQAKADKGAFVYAQLTSIAEQTQAPLRSFLDSRGVGYRAYWIVNMLMVAVDASLLDALAQQPGVERIEAYAPPEPESIDREPSILEDVGPSSPEAVEWNITRVGAEAVWALGITGAGVVVGSMDSGVQWTHPALTNHYRPQIPGAPGRHDYNWFDGLGGSLVPVEHGYHGTVVMGPIVGDDGGSNQIGVAPGAQWIACAGIGNPNANPFDCYQWFIAPTDLTGSNPRPDLAPDVINIAYSSPTDYHAAIQAVRAAGIYPVNAAGNNGYAGCSTVNIYPAQWPEIISAAAFDAADNIWSSSSRGPVLIEHEWYVKPDLAAPGVNVRTSYQGGYITVSGTSLAAPHISGTVALIIAANPELRGQVDLIEMLLKTTAEPRISAECPPFVDIPNNVWGWGILDSYAAVLAAQALEWGTLDGQVYDNATLEPVSGAQLTIRESVSLWPYPAASDILGGYEQMLPPGTYQITATHYGYLDSVIHGIVITAGFTTTQDILMLPAPLWNISGIITDALTGEPLAASLVLEGTPVSTDSDSGTGAYSTDAAQGEWWLVVSSPGYLTEALKVTLDQNRVVNISLEPTINYYMRRSVDGDCGIPFNWVDARTGGTSYNLTDTGYIQVSLPAGRTFTFYENTYGAIYIGNDGMLTFGSGYGNLSHAIPNPAKPNNGIYAFSANLNPFNGAQGLVYTKYVSNRYYVIEWYQVQHNPNGNPETFEIILDLDTQVIKVQYLVVSDASEVLVGVENSDGSEATLYALNDPALVANNVAVVFYPVFGVPPPSGGVGELTGTVTDTLTGLPIEGAMVTGLGYQTGETFTATTGLTGTYAATLCADWYDVTAEAYGYEPGAEVRATVYPVAQTVQNFFLTPVALDSLAISGLTAGWVGTSYTFTAAVEPVTTTLPLTYVWQAEGQAPITHTGGLSDTASFLWPAPGVYTLTVRAANHGSVVTGTHAITITDVPPDGLLAINDSPTLLGSSTTFTATITAGTNVTFAWDFGDGAFGSGAIATHTYAAVGGYTATVTASNSAGADSAETQALIQDVPPAGLQASNDSPTMLGGPTTFTATVTAGTNIVFTWYFGDDSFGTGAVVTHTYAATGVYTATVTATNSNGVVTATTQVQIISPVVRYYLPLVQKQSQPPAGGGGLFELGMVLAVCGVAGWKGRRVRRR